MEYQRNNPKYTGKVSEYAFQYYTALKNIVASFVRLGGFDFYTDYKGATNKCQIKTAGFIAGKNKYRANTSYIVHKKRSDKTPVIPEYRKYTPYMCDFVIIVCPPDKRMANPVFYFIPIEIAKKYAGIYVAPHRKPFEKGYHFDKGYRTELQEYWERFRGTWDVLKGVINLTEVV